MFVVPVVALASMPLKHLAHSDGNFHARFVPSDHQSVVPLVLSCHPLVRVSIFHPSCVRFLSYRPAHLSIARAGAFHHCCRSVVLRSYSVVDGIAIAVVGSYLEPVHSFEK